MRKFFLVWFIFFSVVLGIGWQNVDELYEHLKQTDLTEVQDKEVRILLKNYYRDLKDWWQNNKKINDGVLDLFETDSFLDKRVQEYIQSTYDSKAKIDLNFLKELYSILTKEQRQKLIQSFHHKE